MTSLAHDTDLKGNNFRRSIHPQSFIAVAFIFSELDGGVSGAPPPTPVQNVQKKPCLDRVKKHITRGKETNFQMYNAHIRNFAFSNTPGRWHLRILWYFCIISSMNSLSVTAVILRPEFSYVNRSAKRFSVLVCRLKLSINFSGIFRWLHCNGADPERVDWVASHPR